MFKYLLIAALIACVYADADEAVTKSDVRPDGFEQSLTQKDQSSSSSGDEHGNIKGTYKYETPEGVHVEVNYVADENGYQPTGDLLPTPPPIPAEIVRSLEYLRANAKAEKDY